MWEDFWDTFIYFPDDPFKGRRKQVFIHKEKTIICGGLTSVWWNNFYTIAILIKIFTSGHRPGSHQQGSQIQPLCFLASCQETFQHGTTTRNNCEKLFCDRTLLAGKKQQHNFTCDDQGDPQLCCWQGQQAKAQVRDPCGGSTRGTGSGSVDPGTRRGLRSAEDPHGRVQRWEGGSWNKTKCV